MVFLREKHTSINEIPPLSKEHSMDTTPIETIDTAIYEGEFVPDIEISFGKEIAKTLALSAASTAGMIAGVVVVAYAAGKIEKFRANRRQKANNDTVIEGEVATETPKND